MRKPLLILLGLVLAAASTYTAIDVTPRLFGGSTTQLDDSDRRERVLIFARDLAAGQAIDAGQDLAYREVLASDVDARWTRSRDYADDARIKRRFDRRVLAQPVSQADPVVAEQLGGLASPLVNEGDGIRALVVVRDLPSGTALNAETDLTFLRVPATSVGLVRSSGLAGEAAQKLSFEGRTLAQNAMAGDPITPASLTREGRLRLLVFARPLTAGHLLDAAHDLAWIEVRDSEVEDDWITVSSLQRSADLLSSHQGLQLARDVAARDPVRARLLGSACPAKARHEALIEAENTYLLSPEQVQHALVEGSPASLRVDLWEERHHAAEDGKVEISRRLVVSDVALHIEAYRLQDAGPTAEPDCEAVFYVLDPLGPSDRLRLLNLQQRANAPLLRAWPAGQRPGHGGSMVCTQASCVEIADRTSADDLFREVLSEVPASDGADSTTSPPNREALAIGPQGEDFLPAPPGPAQ